MSLFGRLRKLKHFIGPAPLDGPPVFLNSMPKAGTNLVELFLVELGYKRHPVRCLNESNIHRAKLKPGRGRFYVGHLTEDEPLHALDQTTFLLKRSLWSCLRSYVNYMMIDAAHPVSRFIRETPLTMALERLYFTDDNPNGRRLVDEYTRFYLLDETRYDLVIPFEALVAREQLLVSRLADALGSTQSAVRAALDRAIAGPSYTKNAGHIDLFSELPAETVTRIRARVAQAESVALTSAGAGE